MDIIEELELRTGQIKKQLEELARLANDAQEQGHTIPLNVEALIEKNF